MRRNTPAATPDWEQSKLAIQETGGWIKNADTKTTVLTAAFGVSLTFALPRILDGVTALGGAPVLFGAWLVLMIILVLTIGLTAFGIYRALIPRADVRASQLNRFAWPSVAGLASTDLPPEDRSEEAVRGEAWEQAATLARIAAQKYRSFKLALRAFGTYVIVLALVLTLVTISQHI